VSYGAKADIPMTIKEFNQDTGDITEIRYENALDFLIRSPVSIEQDKIYEQEVHKQIINIAVRTNAKKTLISHLKNLERFKQP
jgi:hypothetical protein